MNSMIHRGPGRDYSKYFGQETEISSITDMRVGDEFYVEDTTESTLTKAFIYTGTGWRHYMNFEV